MVNALKVVVISVLLVLMDPGLAVAGGGGVWREEFQRE